MILEKLGIYWLAFFGIIIVRYFLIAGGSYWFFYSNLGKPFIKRNLRSFPPRWKSIKQDAELALFSAVFFALCAAFIISAYDSGLTRLYSVLDQYGLWYLGFSFVVVLILQDGYFYLLHRGFHHPRLFKWLHHGHHRSGDPTPWTSFAFDLPEAILQGLFFVGIVFLMPLHFITLIALLMTMTVWAVVTHLGFDPFPPSFFRHWFGKCLIGPTHHSIHHRKYRVHYGLYFTFWDKLLGTHDPNYEKEFLE
ncbi:sterol desaturase family protein [Aphanothece hegewaldii]|uniref:sterol desaturase family protein n=1 Tax=Aphanothece hegewaldii TaxID=1521625 RepID=UPI001C637723|nr:sterol desaturase family protein [Aphanothece hegewaldii]